MSIYTSTNIQKSSFNYNCKDQHDESFINPISIDKRFDRLSNHQNYSKTSDTLNKIFIKSLAIKIFTDDVFNKHIEFDIANKFKTDPKNSIELAVKNDCELLVKVFSSISSENLIIAIKSAVIYEKLDILKTIFPNSLIIRDIDLNDIIYHSIQTENESIVEYLLNKNKSKIGVFFIEAARYGKENLIKKLFLRREAIDSFDLGSAIFNAVKNGYESTVKLISPHLTRIDDYHFEESIINASINNRFSIVKFLLSNKTTLSTKKRSEIIMNQASTIIPSILELFLQQGPIDSNYIISIIINATKNKNANIIIDIVNMSELTTESGSLEQENKSELIIVQDLKTNPEKYLDTFSKRDKFPNRFTLEDSIKTIDLGKISKYVIKTLFYSLYEKYYFLWSSEKLLISKDEISESFLIFYSNLAKLISLVDKRNNNRNDRFLIGRIFHPKFFNILKIYLTSSDEEKIKNVLYILKDINFSYKSLYESYINPISICSENCLTKEVEKIIKPIQAFLSGASEALKGKILSSDPEIKLFQIQG